jgi:hypothetical protein
MSKQRLRSRLAAADAEIVRLKIEIAGLGPIVAAAEDIHSACAWHQRATCVAEEEISADAIDESLDALCQAVEARRAGEPLPVADIPDGWVPDAPAQTAEEVAEFLADYEWPGEGVEA